MTGCLIVFLALWVTVDGLNRCNEQWANYGRCFRANVGIETRKNGSKIFADDKKQIMKVAADCFNESECRNPIPTGPELNARTDCFNKVRNTTRMELEDCIRKDDRFGDFQLPQGNVGDYDWALVTGRIRQALKDAREPGKAFCTSRSSINDLMSCLSHAAYDYNHTSQQRPYCSMKNECNKQGVVDGNCKRMWTDELTPVLCSCAQSLDVQRMRKYQDDYQNCVRAKGYSVDSGDPAPYFVTMQDISFLIATMETQLTIAINGDNFTATIRGDGTEQRAELNEMNSNGQTVSQRTTNGDKTTEVKRQRRACRVCGDNAVGFNFNVVTCESCKAFFRRCCFKGKELECPYEGKCRITIRSRKHCAKCRLEKCLRMGMTVENFKRQHPTPSSDEPPSKKICPEPPVEANVGNGGDKNVTNGPVPVPTCENQPPPLKSNDRQLVPFDSAQVEKVHKKSDKGAVITIRLPKEACTNNGINQEDFVTRLVSVIADEGGGGASSKGGIKKQSLPSFTDLNTIIQGPFDPEHVDLWGNEFGKCGDLVEGEQETSPDGTSGCPLPLAYSYCGSRSVHPIGVVANTRMPRWDLGCRLPITTALIPLELKYIKLEELLVAHDESKKMTAVRSIRGTSATDYSKEDFHNLNHFLMSRVVQQHCRLKGLKKLSVAEQIVILKKRAATLTYVQTIVKYDPKTGETEINHPNQVRVSDDITRRFSEDHYNRLKNLKDTFPDHLRRSDTVMVILCAVVLFSPEPIAKKTVLEFERQIYLRLLKDCLDNMMEEKEARWMYRYLLNWITYLHLWVENFHPQSDFNIDPNTFKIIDFRPAQCY